MRKILNRITAFAATTAISASLIVATPGSANASVWECEWGWCTTAWSTTPVHKTHDSPIILYYIQPGEVAALACFGGPWYLGRKPGWAFGWMPGYGLNTGSDPHPSVSPCS